MRKTNNDTKCFHFLRSALDCQNSKWSAILLIRLEGVLYCFITSFHIHVQKKISFENSINIYKSRDGICFVWNLTRSIWATSWENLFMPDANNKGADQPAHPRSLISAFVVRCLDSIMPKVSISKMSSLYLASVPAQAGLSLPRLQTPKTGFLMTRPISFQISVRIWDVRPFAPQERCVKIMQGNQHTFEKVMYTEGKK